MPALPLLLHKGEQREIFFEIIRPSLLIIRTTLHSPDYPVKRSQFNPPLIYPLYIVLTKHSLPSNPDGHQAPIAQTTESWFTY
jgi:hypothetical protein